MRKKVEMGETGCKSKPWGGGGGGKIKLASSPVPSRGPRTHHIPLPTGAQGIAHDTFLTTSKIRGIRAKKNILRAEKKMSGFFFSAESFFAQNIF